MSKPEKDPIPRRATRTHRTPTPFEFARKSKPKSTGREHPKFKKIPFKGAT